MNSSVRLQSVALTTGWTPIIVPSDMAGCNEVQLFCSSGDSEWTIDQITVKILKQNIQEVVGTSVNGGSVVPLQGMRWIANETVCYMAMITGSGTATITFVR
jgi:hypothetical protein